MNNWTQKTLMTPRKKDKVKASVATRDARITYVLGIAKIVTEANETAERSAPEKSA